jgi:hypothetical protein
MVYDAAIAKLVFFGGSFSAAGTTTYYGDTWTWNGSNWLQVPQPKGSKWPAPRDRAALAYDAVHGLVVLFGGASFDSKARVSVYYNDTWTFDGTTWTLLNPTKSPSARISALAYDAVNNNVVLFGGYSLINQTGAVYQDTWLWDGTNWTQKNPTTVPTQRYLNPDGLTYNASSTVAKVVFFGGATFQGDLTVYLNDTWAWDGSNWQQLQEAVAPSARSGQDMIFDAATNDVVLFGGADASAYFNDTWLLIG